MKVGSVRRKRSTKLNRTSQNVILNCDTSSLASCPNSLLVVMLPTTYFLSLELGGSPYCDIGIRVLLVGLAEGVDAVDEEKKEAAEKKDDPELGEIPPIPPPDPTAAPDPCPTPWPCPATPVKLNISVLLACLLDSLASVLACRREV